MAHLNKKTKRVVLGITTLLVIILCCYFVFFQKTKDKFIIEQVHLRKVQLIGDSIIGYHVEPYNSLSKGNNIGIGIMLSKKYLSDKTSKRMLIISSIEPGINGLKEAIKTFDINIKSKNSKQLINDFLYCKNLTSLMPYNDGDYYETSGEKISFTSFIDDINKNERYTSGVRLNDLEKFFWLDSEIIDKIEFDNVEFYYSLKAGNIDEEKLID